MLHVGPSFTGQFSSSGLQAYFQFQTCAGLGPKYQVKCELEAEFGLTCL